MRNIMTPRDEFAKEAMKIYTGIKKPTLINEYFIKNMVKFSYETARAMMDEKYKHDTSLCHDCTKHFATCKSDHEFGLGIGFDNVIKCKTYRKKDNHKIRTFFSRKYFSAKNFIFRIN